MADDEHPLFTAHKEWALRIGEWAAARVPLHSLSVEERNNLLLITLWKVVPRYEPSK